MRIAVILFLFLCFSALGKYNYFHSSTSNSRINYTSIIGLQKTADSKSVKPSKNQFNKNKIPGKAKEHFLIIEDEEDHVFARKYVLLTQYFATLSLSFDLFSVIKFFKLDLPSCSQLSSSSYKYILQRVLRI